MQKRVWEQVWEELFIIWGKLLDLWSKSVRIKMINL